MSENEISAIVTSFLHDHSKRQGHFNSLGGLFGGPPPKAQFDSLCRRSFDCLRIGDVNSILGKIWEDSIYSSDISFPRTLQKCFPVFMCERVSTLVITQLQSTTRPKSRG